MPMGRWKGEQQQPLFITASDLPKSGGHPFYVKLNRLARFNECSVVTHRGPSCSSSAPLKRFHEPADIRAHDHLIPIDLNDVGGHFPHRRQVLADHV